VTRHAGLLAAALVVLTAAAAAAEEQRPAPRVAATTPSRPRVFVNVNGGYQATSTDFRSTVPFRLTTDPTEEAQVETGYGIAAGPVFDVRGGALLYRRLGAAVAVTKFTETGGADVRARVPHPFVFERPREVTGDPSGFRREELGIHMQATYTVPVTRRIVATMFGGPSFFNLQQDLVERVQYSEAYPYDTATFTGVEQRRAKDSGIGFNAGMDVAYFFAKQVGVGGVVRFSRASMNLDAAPGQSQRIDAGGLHLGGGIRFAF